MAVEALDRHIEVTPGIAGGKPRIAGRRITVRDIVIWHERLGKSADEIATECDLTLSDVYAALTISTTAPRSTTPWKKLTPLHRLCVSVRPPSSHGSFGRSYMGRRIRLYTR